MRSGASVLYSPGALYVISAYFLPCLSTCPPPPTDPERSGGVFVRLTGQRTKVRDIQRQTLKFPLGEGWPGAGL